MPFLTRWFGVTERDADRNPEREKADIEAIVEKVLVMQATAAAQQHRGLRRGTHAKGICARAEFEVFDVTAGRDRQLGARLARGLFAAPGIYPAIVRFGNADAKMNSDFKADVRSLSFSVDLTGPQEMQERVARTWTVLSILVVCIVAVPSPAHAHMMNTGFGPFYDGLTHLFVTPEDLLPAIALALLAGLRGPAAGRAVLWSMPLAWFTGCAVVAAAGIDVTTQAVSGVTTFLVGALVAADLPLPIAAAVSVAIALGLVSGTVNGVELANARASSMTAVGIAAALFVLVALVAGHAASIRAPWARVAIRVAGSWIAAIGLLTLGWSLRAP